MWLIFTWKQNVQPISYFWKKTFPPTILFAGRPRIIASRANCCPQFGHSNFPPVSSSTIRSTKHLTRFPVPPWKDNSTCVAGGGEGSVDGEEIYGCQRKQIAKTCLSSAEPLQSQELASSAFEDILIGCHRMPQVAWNTWICLVLYRVGLWLCKVYFCINKPESKFLVYHFWCLPIRVASLLKWVWSVAWIQVQALWWWALWIVKPHLSVLVKILLTTSTEDFHCGGRPLLTGLGHTYRCAAKTQTVSTNSLPESLLKPSDCMQHHWPRNAIQEGELIFMFLSSRLALIALILDQSATMSKGWAVLSRDMKESKKLSSCQWYRRSWKCSWPTDLKL